MQSEFYPTIENRYGVPLDTRHDYTKGLASFLSVPDTDMYLILTMNSRLGNLRRSRRINEYPRHVPEGPGRVDQRDPD